MNKQIRDFVLEVTGASAISSQQVIQTLWSGYGEIVRTELVDSELKSVVLKYIVLPSETNHPRGWNTNLSHARKIKSYAVEMHWYRDWSQRCGQACRVAHCYATTAAADESVIVLEDLNAAGFPLRKSDLNMAEVKLCLNWLANFHATFMAEKPDGLWQTGTYWHLETRPDEWAAMAEGDLKNAAAQLDRRLNDCRYQTLVHGDAKVDNFCFSANGQAVAALDFQYVGAGCGMKDVVYLLGSCLSEQQCEQWQQELLDYYFAVLQQALKTTDKPLEWDQLKTEWQAMYAIAWADFYRFLSGWMPSHRKINPYTERLAAEAIASLNQ
ncbi:MAG TPA: DUF1679 domain-containing protein [Candidatus Tenderia electrophaga]|uniref:DUF1679 domain-containing protein n=1 Tax=Candidatus Tenderia electrophaga TaxID=1748243 RepID=A0A832N4W0_9GAMM|nr:DUF1679 domain-containing protein [Candidatus Tenderia electrophaga]